MNFIKTIINAIKAWTNGNFISHNKQDLSEVQKVQAQENIGVINATDSDIHDVLIEIDMMPAVADENGNILTDENDAILLI